MKFFSSSMRLHVIFFALQHSEEISFCVDGVEKVVIPFLLLATLAAVLFNSNRGLILAFVRFNSTADHCNAASTTCFPFASSSTALTCSCRTGF